MSLSIVNGDVLLFHGDSTDDRAFQYQAWKEFELSVRAKQPQTRSVSISINGATIATLAGTVVADIAKYRPTVYLAAIGVNDAIGGSTQNTVQTGLTTILNATAGAGVKTYISGPLCVFEKTDGSNALDTALVNVNTWMAQTCTGFALATFINMRTRVFNVYGPLQNLPAPGITVDGFTRPDAAGDHVNPNGRHLCTVEWSKDIAF